MFRKAANIVHQSIAVKEAFISQGLAETLQAAQVIAQAILKRNKLIIFGNGGSAADAQHMAAEFVNRFLMERPELPALALTTDSSALTAIANDYSFEEVFSKQVKALGREGDVALGLSTSGRSANVLRALAAAKDRGLETVALVGNNRNEVSPLCDIVISVPSDHTPRVQETHGLVIHIICETVDNILFPSPLTPE
ncbi:MAG: D-sedoheptulose 7-phosphate isomerase [Desulfarculales bacterium]|nr:D-sedoheptulose 7-phosphate isomerase [Desulfarculales bacterium]